MNLKRRMFRGGAALGGAALLMGQDIFAADDTSMPLSGSMAQLMANGELPGTKRLYAMRNGQGEYHLFGGQVASLIARRQDTGGIFEAAILTGSKGASLPLHIHAQSAEAFYVMDGKVELWLDGKAYLLSRGDYASIPAGIEHGHIMRSWRSRVLTWSIGDKVGPIYAALGTPFTRAVQPDVIDLIISPEALRKAEAAADVTFTGNNPDFGSPPMVASALLPTTNVPYVLEEGEGERLVAADQLYSFLQTQKSSGDQFIAVTTEGPAGEAIPWHYHKSTLKISSA